MSEFCVKCWNELNGTHDRRSAFVLSEELDICEGCGEWKHVIVCYKQPFFIVIIEKIIEAIKHIFLKIKTRKKK